MHTQALSVSQPSQIYLPWRGRYYLPKQPPQQLVIARTLSELAPLRRLSAGQRPTKPAREPYRPTYPHGIARLLHDYQLVELDPLPAIPASLAAPITLPAPTQNSPLLPSTRAWPLEQLSKREREVLALIAAGLSNHEIAEALMLTPGTVKWHVHNVYGKLGVTRRTQAVARAQLLGLLNNV